MCKITDVPVSHSPPCGSSSAAAASKSNLVMMTNQTQQQQQQQQQQRKRSVRFGNIVEHVFEKQFTEEDLPMIWYNGEEFYAMKEEIYAMIRHVNKKRSFDHHYTTTTTTTTECNINEEEEAKMEWNWRGFEHIRQQRPRREIRRRHAEDLLYFHKVMNINDPIGLGLYAGSNSRQSLERARELAILDESEAFEIYNETLSELSLVVAQESADYSNEENDDNVASETEHETEPQTDPKQYTTEPAVPSMSICRDEDDKRTHLLQQDVQMPSSFLPMEQDGTSLSLSFLISPYRLVVMLFPCVC